MRSERRTIQQAFRFELDPNREQRVLLAKNVGASRYVYNWGLAESKRQYELTGKRPRLGELKARLVGLKQTETPWLYEVSAHIGLSERVLRCAASRWIGTRTPRSISAGSGWRGYRWIAG